MEGGGERRERAEERVRGVRKRKFTFFLSI
jgi:hypothetical protein